MILSGRLPEVVEVTVRTLSVSGARVAGVVADMTSKEGAARISAAARAAFGDPDILVINSPGPVPDRTTNRWRGFDNCQDEDFVEVHRNFVMSTVYLVREVIPAMKAKK